MEKGNRTQLELFSQEQKGYDRIKMHKNPFFSYMRSYEKAILIIISFVICGIVSFSLGVEKGKRLEYQSRPPSINLKDIESSKVPIQPKIEKKDTFDNYTIQVASYRNKSRAQKEAQALTKKGFSPLILSKSGYAVLCVGNFSDREIAKSLLSELKKRYQDCFIRRL